MTVLSPFSLKKSYFDIFDRFNALPVVGYFRRYLLFIFGVLMPKVPFFSIFHMFVYFDDTRSKKKIQNDSEIFYVIIFLPMTSFATILMRS